MNWYQFDDAGWKYREGSCDNFLIFAVSPNYKQKKVIIWETFLWPTKLMTTNLEIASCIRRQIARFLLRKDFLEFLLTKIFT